MTNGLHTNEQLSTRTLETERGVTDYSQNDESEVCASFFVGGGIEMSFSINMLFITHTGIYYSNVFPTDIL